MIQTHHNDPTVALFLSEGAASKASRLVMRKYAGRVSKTHIKMRKHHGEILGYALALNFTDKRPQSWLTNSDFERLSWTNPKDNK
jgi:hypothetical protein